MDDTTRLIQHDLTVYDDVSDTYVRVTVAFERLDVQRWKPICKVETAYFRGVLGHGNYHGVVDDAKVVFLPLLTCLLTCVLAGCVVRLAKETRRAYGRHGVKLLLCAAAVGMSAARVYYSVAAAREFDRMMDDAYKDATPQVLMMLTTQASRAEYLRAQHHHLPFAKLVREDGHAREASVGVIIVTLVHFCLYDYYYSSYATLLIVGVRRVGRHVVPFLIFYFLTNLALAIVGHVMFSKCWAAFCEKTLAYTFLVFFQLTGDLDYEEIEQCDRLWGPIFCDVCVLVLYIVLFNFTYEHVMGMIDSTRQEGARQEERRAERLDMEREGYPLTRQGRLYRQHRDRLYLAWLHQFLTSRQ